MASEAEWPVVQPKQATGSHSESATSDVRELCDPGAGGNRDVLDGLLAAAAAALPEFSGRHYVHYFACGTGRTN